MAVESWSELELVRRVLRLAQTDLPDGALGIGDDAAATPFTPGQLPLATTDLLVEGVHFEAGAPARVLGRRAAAVNLSDIAAMGGRPRYLLAAIALPAGFPLADAGELLAGIHERGLRHGAPLIGGDTTSSPGPLVISVTALGEVGRDRILTRSGAQAGDRLIVTGTLGDAAAGLAARRAGLAGEPAWAALLARLDDPEPEIELGGLLGQSGLAGAAIDLSDGLAGDIRHLCQASGLGAVIELAAVPIAGPARELAARLGCDPLDWALAGGDDYRLALAVPPAALDRARALARGRGRELHDLGCFVDRPGVWEKLADGSIRTLERTGYEHRG